MKKGFYLFLAGIVAALLVLAGIFFSFRALRAPATAGGGESVLFEVSEGEGFRDISKRLKDERLIRSRRTFEVYAVLMGAARRLRPGTYRFSPDMSIGTIVRDLRTGEGRDVAVTVPEGATIHDIDKALGDAKVLPSGEFAKFAQENDLEGYLFPDTYRFYYDSTPEDVAARFRVRFDEVVLPLLPADKDKARELIIAASILEKEVPSMEDRQLVMGILIERMRIGMALQVDASVCYAKRLASEGAPCYPVTRLDTKMTSPYNTYLHKGWPPGPIGNPGISAVKAALSPIESPYLYYLSDPATKKTIFSKDLEEHERNRSKYLTS